MTAVATADLPVKPFYNKTIFQQNGLALRRDNVVCHSRFDSDYTKTQNCVSLPGWQRTATTSATVRHLLSSHGPDRGPEPS